MSSYYGTFCYPSLLRYFIIYNFMMKSVMGESPFRGNELFKMMIFETKYQRNLHFLRFFIFRVFFTFRPAVVFYHYFKSKSMVLKGFLIRHEPTRPEPNRPDPPDPTGSKLPNKTIDFGTIFCYAYIVKKNVTKSIVLKGV